MTFELVLFASGALVGIIGCFVFAKANADDESYGIVAIFLGLFSFVCLTFAVVITAHVVQVELNNYYAAHDVTYSATEVARRPSQ